MLIWERCALVHNYRSKQRGQVIVFYLCHLFVDRAMDKENRDNLIRLYHNMGMSYKDIVSALCSEHGIFLSLRHLKRILKANGLFRRKGYSAIGEVVDFIHSQLKQSGQLHGYRWMFQKLKDRGLCCKKEDVRTILRVLNPDVVQQRRRRRLQRRTYFSKGPNYIWHLDSYDKLKRFGFCINGCIDGFSRLVLWINVYKTSNDPRIIGGYYLETIKALGGCPRVLRSDFGTENTHVGRFQRFLRRNGTDSRAGQSSMIQGASTSNQRIEYWWSFFRKECSDFWIEIFSQLEADGLFNGTFVDVSLLQYCFMHLVQV